jgi:hypothetical protein
MTDLRYFSSPLEFSFTGDTPATRKLCQSYKERRATEVTRAKSHSPKLLQWLECGTLWVPGFTLPDRLAGRSSRTSAQLSTLNDGTRRTPANRLEWFTRDDGQSRDRREGLLAWSDRTMTLARHWARPMPACTPANDGWLTYTTGLLQQPTQKGSSPTIIWEESPPVIAGIGYPVLLMGPVTLATSAF